MSPTSATPASSQSRPLWQGPLVAGLCFGLAYGVAQRLLSFNVGELIRFGSGFDVQVFPGTSLESLKLRFGDAEAEITGDLELQELERQQQLEASQRQEQARQAEAELQRSQQLEPDAPAAADGEPLAPPAPAPLPTGEPPAAPAAQP
ncbi:MAG: hypothetical protein FJ056_07655 [Cyanobacteria bacterium M_surface_10_m2_179]|nr:hypothetical protein [Cyanobacteria bacterium M_surface_10_m2_179]